MDLDRVNKTNDTFCSRDLWNEYAFWIALELAFLGTVRSWEVGSKRVCILDNLQELSLPTEWHSVCGGETGRWLFN